MRKCDLCGYGLLKGMHLFIASLETTILLDFGILRESEFPRATLTELNDSQKPLNIRAGTEKTVIR